MHFPTIKKNNSTPFPIEELLFSTRANEHYCTFDVDNFYSKIRDIGLVFVSTNWKGTKTMVKGSSYSQ